MTDWTSHPGDGPPVNAASGSDPEIDVDPWQVTAPQPAVAPSLPEGGVMTGGTSATSGTGVGTSAGNPVFPPLGPPPPSYPPLGGVGTPPSLPPLPPAPSGPEAAEGPGPANPGRRRRVVVAAVAGAVALVAGAFVIGRASAPSSSGATGAVAISTASTLEPGGSTTTILTGNGPGSPAASTTASTAKGSSSASTPSTAKPNTNAPSLDSSLEPAAAVNKAVSPAVVQIETGSGLGTGFIYDKTGYILTAAHVVEGERSVIVRLASGASRNGTVVGADVNYDVAVVKIDPEGELPTVSLALGEAPIVGQTAIAIGSPFGLDQTVTQGIVSAVNRPVPTRNQSSYVGMIQTDAAINTGNSGGPLVNRQGKVIGINVQIRTNTGDNAGIGFAVPLDTAYEVAQALIAGKPIEIGYLGVSSSGDTTDGRTGALITRVEAASPASQAGLQVGDLVTAIDGVPVKDFTALAAAIRAHRPGDKVALSIERNGQRQEVTVTVGKASR